LSRLQFIDQTLRDAQQSLWGFRMSTDQLAPILPVMDQVGYKAIATVGARGIIVTMRAFKEDPFERMRLMSRTLQKTPLRGSFWAWNLQGWDLEPLAPIELWIKVQVANGVRSFWVCDYQNLNERLSYLVDVAKSEGAEVVVALLYAVSPVHTNEHFEEKARKLSGVHGIDAIHVEDASGIRTPERTRELLPAIRRGSNNMPIQFHAHCTNGQAPLCYLEAMKLGFDTFHTAVSPLANGNSLPSIEHILKNAHRLGFSSDIQMDSLIAVSDHFTAIALENDLPMGKLSEYDVFLYEHQLPGGMMGTLKNQLTELGMVNRMEELLEEICRIRKDFGYPVMATPYSQIVGSQAVFNITSGERYKIVPDEVIKYAAGIYGEPNGPMDQEAKDKILSSAKAKRFLNWSPPDVSLKALRKEIGSTLSDEALLLRLLNPDAEVKGKLRRLYGGNS
jgi:oxaloacetate decarboxylase (Na+ extruding) subunit alpha